MDVITISDDSSPRSSRSTPSRRGLQSPRRSSSSSLPITIETESTQRCPVTWCSDKKQGGDVAAQYLTDNLVPALNNRVHMWLTSTVQLQQATTVTSPLHHSITDHSDSRSSPSIVDSYFNNSIHREQLPKRNILIRHDFTPNNEVVPSICSYESSLRSRSNDIQLNGYGVNKVYQNAETDENSDSSNESVKKGRSKFNNEVPLSPETQKKNELCTYLQLMNMNCTDRKLASKIQNRRSTRVKNLMQMTKRKELERQLNTEVKKKEKEPSIDEKKKTILLTLLEEAKNEVGKTAKFENNEKQNFTLHQNPQNELRRNSSSKTLYNFNLDTKQPKAKSNLDTRSENIQLTHGNSLNCNMKRRNSECSNLDLTRGKGQSNNDLTLKLLGIHNIPKEMLNKCIDFDETIEVFMKSENCIPKPHKVESKCKKTVKKDEITTAYVKRRYIKKPRYTNGSFKNLSSSSSPKSIFNKTQLKLLQSQSPYRNRLKKKLIQASHSTMSKQRFKGKQKKYCTIVLRNTGRQNLRSKRSLSKIGIKTLILKDKNDNDEDRKPAKMKKQRMYKEHSKSVKPKIRTKVSESSNKKAIIDNGKFIDEDIEIVSLANSVPPKLRGKVGVTLYDEGNIIKTATPKLLEKTVETPNTIQNFTNKSIRKESPNETISRSEIRIINTPKKSDAINSVSERTFNIIDLSHSKTPSTIDTITDHDYIIKSPGDKNYIMDVILGTNEKSPVIETVEMISISEDSYCKSPGNLSPCTEQEYNREKLEEIIGIPWKNAQKNDKNKSNDSLNTIRVSDATIEVREQKSPTKSSSEYTSQESVVLKLSSPNKMYNIRVPHLHHASTNIFEEEPCSLMEAQATPSDEVDVRPRIIPMPIPSEVKSLHKSLMHSKRRLQMRNELSGESSNHTWDNDNSCEDKRSHSIRIFPNNGNIVNAFYVDFNLTIVQEQSVSFWCQSALGNMLGSQDLWISKGSLQRLVLDNTCVFKESSDMIISLENSFAYVELWTKEHKSDKRERPLADVFATVYFWRHRQNVPNRKFLQLENINGKGSDVQYIVLRNSRSIVVSWVEIRDDMKKTVVHCYSLAPDYQTVVSIREMDTVDHCVTSLHNIEDCNTMVMGFGEEQVTLWNLEYGYVVATIEIKSISVNPRCVWIKCDRGFLFLLQYHQIERLLVLIAINGITHSWKRLQVFRAPYGYDGLQGVCIDNNVLAAFYQRGVLCWNIQSGESVIEEMSSQTTYLPCDKHIVMLNSDKVQVQQFLSYFITSFDLQ